MKTLWIRFNCLFFGKTFVYVSHQFYKQVYYDFTCVWFNFFTTIFLLPLAFPNCTCFLVVACDSLLYFSFRFRKGRNRGSHFLRVHGGTSQPASQTVRQTFLGNPQMYRAEIINDLGKKMMEIRKIW